MCFTRWLCLQTPMTPPDGFLAPQSWEIWKIWKKIKNFKTCSQCYNYIIRDDLCIFGDYWVLGPPGPDPGLHKPLILNRCFSQRDSNCNSLPNARRSRFQKAAESEWAKPESCVKEPFTNLARINQHLKQSCIIGSLYTIQTLQSFIYRPFTRVH